MRRWEAKSRTDARRNHRPPIVFRAEQVVAIMGFALVAWAASVPFDAVAQDSAPTNSATASSATASSAGTTSAGVDWVGINGHYRAGQWTAVRIKDALKSVSTASRSPSERPDGSGDSDDWGGQFILETTDGDGVVVQFDQPPRSGSGFAYCVPGTEAAPLVIRTGKGSTKRVVVKSRFPEQGVPANGPSMIPLGMPWILVIGDSLDIDTIGANDLLDRDASVAVTRVTDADSIPNHVLGLSGLDMILITGSGREVLDAISPAQSLAIVQWVRAGGRLMITLGATAKQTMQSAPWLADLLPEPVSQAPIVRLDPSGMETFTSSQTRLSVFDGIRLPKVTSLTGGRSSRIGETLIAGRTARRISLPLASRYVAGFGKVLVVAADLEQSPFDEWPERFDLVTKLADKELSDDRGDASGSIRLSGYSDLSGQVRRSLDQFPIKRSLNFSVIALVIVGLVILVAPLDYFVVRRLLGSSLLGWVTFPVVAVVMSIGLVMASQPQTDGPPLTAAESVPEKTAFSELPSLLRSNSIEILDLDVSTKMGRLFRWAFVYSHTAQKVVAEVQPNEALDSLTNSVEYQTLRPFGQAGVSMGGIQIDAWSDSIDVPLSLIDSPNKADDPQNPGIVSRVESLQIAPRGSKSLALSMQFSTHLTSDSVKRRGGSELLQGKLTNPLEVDLLEAMLVYQNWVYLLPTRFPAGATVEDIDRLRQKNFRWQLSRQRALESSSEGESWDVTNKDQPKRLAEMLMFHEAVGGIRYTGLRHEVLGDLDLSELLTEDRCLLVGRCRLPWTVLDVRTANSDDRRDDTTSVAVKPVGPSSSNADATDPNSGELMGETSSWVRVLIPVEELRR